MRDKTDGKVWHQCDYRTQYVDTDRSKVVYHANYLHYYDFGRTSLMRDAGYPYLEIEENGYLYPIIEIGVKYHSPLYYDDPMRIYTRPGLLERVRLQFDYIILNEKNNIICRGFTKHCAMNTSGTPVAIDDKTVHLWKVFPK
ncbi:MAG: acyl-CoA thioesterase [Desulfobacterales bacterium]|nr:acyl-CoA thioesterase [Desulfobacterales bacterium]